MLRNTSATATLSVTVAEMVRFLPTSCVDGLAATSLMCGGMKSPSTISNCLVADIASFPFTSFAYM